MAPVNTTDRSPQCIPTSYSNPHVPAPPTSSAVPSAGDADPSPTDRLSSPGPGRDTHLVRVSSTRLIGRERELSELEAALGDAAEGHPSLAFLAGESGVGKSRLLGELEHRTRERGWSVLSGDCVELGEGELPYAPIVAALRPLVRAGDPRLETLPGTERLALSRLLPGLGDAAQPNTAQDEATAQAQLFEALLALLDALGRAAPVLLAIEDLHWADRSTRAFVAFLSRALCSERVLVVFTYRPDELHRRHPLRPLLADVEREARSRRVEIAALSRDELAQQLADILGAAPEAGLAERLWTRGGGNPLFTEELLAGGLDGRGAPPATLRDALMVRVERLGESAQELLRLLAAGQRLDHVLLAEAARLDAADLRAALREAVAGHIVVVDDDGAYAFRHALLREVVEDDLLPGEHADLHRRLAGALERRVEAEGARAGAHLTASVAHHHQAAGDRPAALTASLRAADASDKVHAHGEALALLERALELWPLVRNAAKLAGCRHSDVLARAAQAADLNGDNTRAEGLLEAALRDPLLEGDPHRVALLLERLARVQRRLGKTDDSLATLERGLALLPTHEAGAERARLLSSKAKVRMLSGRYRDGEQVAREALQAARVSGDRVAESQSLNALGVCLAELGALDDGIAALERATAIAREDERPGDLANAYTNLADVLHLHGRGRDALAVALEGLVQPGISRSSADWLSTSIAEMAFDLGDWALADAHLPVHERRRTGHALLNVALRRAELALARGEDAVARAALDSARHVEAGGEPQLHGPLSALVAELARRSGDLPAARAAVEEALDRIEFCTEDVMRLARVAAAGIVVEADAAQRARDLGDHPAAAAAMDRAAALLERVEAAAEGDRPVESATLIGARAEVARAAGRPDAEAYAAAAAAWTALGRPHPAALMQWREAEAHLARGAREPAGAAASRAYAGATALGAGWLRRELEGLAARARLELAPDRPVPGPAEPVADAPFGLTPRERQVLVLVARGATNREIGAELFMAEKTASVHVSRILAKLDVRSRTEAAAVAHRQGFDDEEVAFSVGSA